MSTSGGGTLNALAYGVILAAVLAAAAGVLPGGLEPALRRPHRAALGLWAAVAVPSLVQIAWPPLLDALSRQPELIRDGRQVWRLLTSELVQDGGLFGTAFNLVVLYLVACIAVPLWGPVRAVGLFLVGAMAFDLTAVFVVPSAGAGNSGATFALATSVLGLLVLRNRSPRVVVATAVAAAVAVALVVARDAHGLAFLGGLVLGLLVGAAGRVRTVREDRKDPTR